MAKFLRIFSSFIYGGRPIYMGAYVWNKWLKILIEIYFAETMCNNDNLIMIWLTQFL